MIGIIGGTGVYALEGLHDVHALEVDTPFGAPSDALSIGSLGRAKLVFIPRHGRGHRLLPSEIPYRANIFALKQLGVEWLISVSAVGSMREEIHPGEMVIPTQYIDRTVGRAGTFFGDGIAAHAPMGDPTCVPLGEHLHASAEACGVTVHMGGTYLCIEGPAFSTRAESNLYRQWGVDVIGMTAMPEARLAREAEIHYATLALVTDYDCWHQTEEDVNVAGVVAILQQNAANVRRLLAHAAPSLPTTTPPCSCARAMAHAFISDKAAIPKERAQALSAIIGKYV
ncbi:MAG: S-methyl-5'-thioadenosine phosphorylase [Deltaproteobacteria bacterium]|nr:S-methyl-5'-thioadenosine phosphorylase [Deltaproteobacteria bacterium]